MDEHPLISPCVRNPRQRFPTASHSLSRSATVF
jgi:hypothetical protein